MSASLSSPQRNSDGSISVTATVTDGGVVEALPGYTYSWTVSKGGSPWKSFPDSYKPSLNFTPDGIGTYAVQVTAYENDDHDVSATATSTSVTVTAPHG